MNNDVNVMKVKRRNNKEIENTEVLENEVEAPAKLHEGAESSETTGSYLTKDEHGQKVRLRPGEQHYRAPEKETEARRPKMIHTPEKPTEQVIDEHMFTMVPASCAWSRGSRATSIEQAQRRHSGFADGLLFCRQNVSRRRRKDAPRDNFGG